MAATAHPLRRALPYVVGAAMFALAAWVLLRTLRQYELADLGAELAQVGSVDVAGAILLSALSFLALMGYEHSALRLIGQRVPWRRLAMASFCTQSIAHSTGFAFVTGATLRYQFYASRGITLTDVAKIQIIFTATFTLGVSTLAGAVILLEPGHLTAATGLPGWAWRAGAATALVLVACYVVWGAYFHRPLRWRGHTLTLPGAAATLTQIFWGVADLLAVAGALYMLMPDALGLGYIDVLTIFMASIVVGLMSHVPGSLGVFESAVVLLVRPVPGQELPLLGALVAFRACYYLLPLICGVALLTLYEGARWRHVVHAGGRVVRDRLAPHVPRLAGALAFLGGAILLLATLTPVPPAQAERITARLPQGAIGFGNTLSSVGGLGLLVMARGLAMRVQSAWRWGLMLLAAGLVVSLVMAESAIVTVPLAAGVALLLSARTAFDQPTPPLVDWWTPGWLVAFLAAVGMAVWFFSRV